MVSKEKMLMDVKWATRQRLQFIEIMAFYTGTVSRSDVARAFGISDPAATKDLKLYGDLAPGNLIYTQAVFGFVPAPGFRPVFADLSPATVLPLLAANLAVAGGPYGQESIYGLSTAALPLPTRLPGAEVLAQITRAIHGHRKLRVSYRSLSDREASESRVIEPHALVDTGLRWHVRAYSEDTYDFRDFVLSRFVTAECLDAQAESSAEHDEDWVETASLRLAPHAGLGEDKRAKLLLDYGADSDPIEITVRRALIGYLLQRLSVDTTPNHSRNPNAYQLMLLNREDIEPFAGWALQ
jgi:predicted DNA-binding transcriptional regulator YafY